MTKKYPIGTKIRFIADESCYSAALADDGKIGTVVKIKDMLVCIYLPDSKQWENTVEDAPKDITWTTKWECVEPVKEIGKQLLFSFMDEYYGK